MKKSILILLLALTTTAVHASKHVPDSAMHRDGLYVNGMKIYPDSAIYQGINFKLDLFNTSYYLIKSKAQFQTYEIAMNLRLKQRFYPTLELGYAFGQLGNGYTLWNGQGGWANVGLDLNGLRKSQTSQNALLVGIRVGTAVQQYDLQNVYVEDSYWQIEQTTNYLQQWHTDCWGEVVAGCQVQVVGGLMMGWYLRLKVLFTRKEDGINPYPYFIPGYGYRDYSQWGISYYIGWKF